MSLQERVSETKATPQKRTLHRISLVLIAGGSLFTILLLVLWRLEAAALLDAVGTAIVVLFGILIYLLTRQDRLLLAGVVVVGLLLIVTAYCMLIEGPQLASILFFSGGVVFADLLVGGRSGLIVAGLATLLYLAVGLVHELGGVEATYVAPFVVDVITVALVLAGLALVAGTLTREMRMALQQAQDREVALYAVDEEKSRLVQELQAREMTQRHLLETVREMGSPIIPLAKGVIAMPLIGAVDSQRAQEVTTALLDGVEEYRARVAIVDITGVPVVNIAVAEALLKAAQGVRLLGAEPVLTGIQAEVAQTIVGLGLDFSGVITRATLQEGLEYALGSMHGVGEQPRAEGRGPTAETRGQK